MPAWTNLPSLVTGVQPFSSSLLPLLGPLPPLLPKDLFGASGADISDVLTSLSECTWKAGGGGFRSINVREKRRELEDGEVFFFQAHAVGSQRLDCHVGLPS